MKQKLKQWLEGLKEIFEDDSALSPSFMAVWIVILFALLLLMFVWAVQP